VLDSRKLYRALLADVSRAHPVVVCRSAISLLVYIGILGDFLKGCNSRGMHDKACGQ
jgi:hypothetical protein